MTHTILDVDADDNGDFVPVRLEDRLHPTSTGYEFVDACSYQGGIPKENGMDGNYVY